MKLIKHPILIVLMQAALPAELAAMSWFRSKPVKTLDPAEYMAHKALDWAKKNPKTSAALLLATGVAGGYLLWDWYCSPDDAVPKLTEKEAVKKLSELIDLDLQTVGRRGQKSVAPEKYPKAGSYADLFTGCRRAYLEVALHKYTRLFQHCMAKTDDTSCSEFEKLALSIKKQLLSWYSF